MNSQNTPALHQPPGPPLHTRILLRLLGTLYMGIGMYLFLFAGILVGVLATAWLQRWTPQTLAAIGASLVVVLAAVIIAAMAAGVIRTGRRFRQYQKQAYEWAVYAHLGLVLVTCFDLVRQKHPLRTRDLIFIAVNVALFVYLRRRTIQQYFV